MQLDRMHGYLIFLVVLFLALVIAAMMTTKSGFMNYIVLPVRGWRGRWRQLRPWGYNPYTWSRPSWASSRPSYAWRYQREGFENVATNAGPATQIDAEEKQDSVMEYPPDSPAPAKLYNLVPYHLLGDEYSPPGYPEHISNVNSRSCYATDFQPLIEKTGNFAQMTNNYKRQYPDSCTGTYQELVNSFYKVDPMILTGK